MVSHNIATAPVSWGVWFPDDKQQIPWEKCLDEMEKAGYEGLELGPWGYLPYESNQLRKELDKRNMTLVATTLMDDLTSIENTARMINQLNNMASLQTSFKDAKYVVLIDACYTDLFTGERIRKKELNLEEKEIFFQNIERIQRYAKEMFGLEVVYHPHAQTHVETEEEIDELLKRTNINLCFDTGHHAYMGGDVIKFIETNQDRIKYIHLKNCDPVVLEQTKKHGWSLARAVKEGVMTEPSSGMVDMRKLLEVLNEADFSGWIVVEQDMYPAPFEKPFPIAKRTREYLKEIEIG